MEASITTENGPRKNQQELHSVRWPQKTPKSRFDEGVVCLQIASFQSSLHDSAAHSHKGKFFQVRDR